MTLQTDTLYNCTVPRQTLTTAPVTFSLVFPPAQLDRVLVRVPRGCNGCVGFYLAMGGVQVIPSASGLYIVTDDEVLTWELADLPNSGAWSLVAYNLGYYPHNLQVQMTTEPVPDTVPGATPAIISAAALSTS